MSSPKVKGFWIDRHELHAEPGHLQTVGGLTILCENGLHFSPAIEDAHAHIRANNGRTAHLVEAWGGLKKGTYKPKWAKGKVFKKAVANNRRVLSSIDLVRDPPDDKNKRLAYFKDLEKALKLQAEFNLKWLLK